ncbi:MAG: hypothetical protein ACTJFR_04455 [Canibacter sp.]
MTTVVLQYLQNGPTADAIEPFRSVPPTGVEPATYGSDSIALAEVIELFQPPHNKMVTSRLA